MQGEPTRRVAEPSREFLMRSLDRNLLTPPLVDQRADRVDGVVGAGDIARSDEYGGVEEAVRVTQCGHKDPSRRRRSAA